jgi:DNA-directed RNA polymerase I subunit RPA1
MADPSHPIPSEATSVSFSFLSSQDVRRISVKQVSDPQLFDGLNNPTLGGLYDPAFGPLQRYDVLVAALPRTGLKFEEILTMGRTSRSCHTCRLKGVDCPGHFGHIGQSFQLLESILVRLSGRI